MASSTLSNVVIKFGFQCNIASGGLAGTVSHLMPDQRPNIGIATGQTNICFSKDVSVVAGSPQDFAAFIKEEDPKWIGMAKLSGLKAE